MSQVYTEHIAGEMVDGLQTCTRCGAVVTDYRGARVMVHPPLPAGERLGGWEPGPVYKFGEGSWMKGRPDLFVRCDEQPT